MTTISADVRAIVESAHLCFAATVGPDQRPNLSPKGTIRVWDDGHVFFLDIASPGTRRNLEANPAIELNVVDTLSRRGYRLSGEATLHRDGAVFEEARRRVLAEEGVDYPVQCVVMVRVLESRELVSPGYEHVADEPTMRAAWRERRARLDAEFEQFMVRRPWSNLPRVGSAMEGDADQGGREDEQRLG